MTFLAYSFDIATFGGIAIMVLIFGVFATPVILLRPKIIDNTAKWRNRRQKILFGIFLSLFALALILIPVVGVILSR